ncbi:MAG: hypothetical protein V4515_12715 [Chloroflexota bacterium]
MENLQYLAGWIPQTSATAVLLAAVWAVLQGRIIPRSTHEEVRRDRDAYRTGADTALAATREMATNVARLTAAVEQLAASQRETLSLVHQLLPARPQ